MAGGRVLDVAEKHESLNDWPEAISAYRRALEEVDTVGDRLHVLLRLARCLLESGRSGEADEAESCLSQAGRLLPDDDPAVEGRFRLQLGRLLEYKGDLRQALQSYERAGELLDATSERVDAQLVLASAERRRGELQRAVDRLNGLDRNTLTPRQRADFYDELGAVHLSRGEVRKAIEIFETALELDQNSADEYSASKSRLLLADAYLRSHNLVKARSLIEQALLTYEGKHANAGRSEALSLMGKYYEESEDFVLAAQYYQAGLDLDRSSDDVIGQVRARRNLGRVFRKKGESARASEFFAAARASFPREDDVEMAALWTEEGHLAMEGAEPDYSEAIHCFNRALEIATEDCDERAIAVAKRNLANALRENNELRAAEELLREAIPLLEERGDLRELDEAYDDLGQVLLEQDRYEEAQDALLRSLDLDRQLGTVRSQSRSLLLLGRTYLQMGERLKARDAFQDIFDLYHHSDTTVDRSEVLHELGSWYAEEGKLDDAIRCFKEGLGIDQRRDDRIGMIRANRSLAGVYRRRGDLVRSCELLDEAEEELRRINDPMERAQLQVERGRQALAQGSYREARDQLESAMRVFSAEKTQSRVQAATCQRLLANVFTSQGDYDTALDLLGRAKRVFEEARDMPELDEIYDDYATVHLLAGDLDRAEDAVRTSLGIGRTMGWDYGKGRSLLLLGRIYLHRSDMTLAFKHFEDALDTYEEIDDDVGKAEAYVHLGDWYAHPGNPGHELSRAIAMYKRARVIEHEHRNQRGIGRCNRKLAHAYLMANELQRAEDALEQAEDDLRGVDDPRETAPFEFEKGALHAARAEHSAAISSFRRALAEFQSLGLTEDVTRTYQSLIASYQALGQFREALECMRDMGLEQASMWNVLVRDLHPMVAEKSHATFSRGLYQDAITTAFGALEHEFRRRAEALGDAAPPTTAAVSDVIRTWLKSELDDVPVFSKRSTTDRFVEFCVASFDIIRNSAVHTRRTITAGDAFASLAVAHLIASTIESASDA